ncbi:MAG: hypothetical protein LPK45_04775 [Bacteroidota bacterium]|nr:hypothetical protein [Bacteroidota bacterium]MDX5430370.1 hypothetical protein [Bacteroidota bacterium]MDX5469131.1 hypothetical protein [Bacteroidota bacterium]
MISGTSYLVKRLLALLVISSYSFLAFGQQSTLDVPDSVINRDSTKQIKLLIVPFNPAMYFSDADKDIGEITNVEPKEVRNRVNSSLESTVSEELNLYYEAKSLSKQKDALDDLDLIYGSIDYAPTEIVEPETEKKPALKGFKDRLNPKEDDPNQEKDPETYMDIAFADGRLMEYITSKYEVDYVIFFNQFEIRTDYKNCIDLQLRQYYREIKVHYTVLSKDGKKISGDVISIPYHSNENNLSVIVQENFGQISNQLLDRIYLKK